MPRPRELTSLTDWLSGCEAAHQFLTPVDYKRRPDSQYWFGWNKAQPPTSAATVTSTGGYQIGPSYDCVKIDRALEQFICSDSDLSRADLSFVRIYCALRWQVGRDGWQDLKTEAMQNQLAAMATCGIGANGDVLPDNRVALKSCLLGAYAAQGVAWSEKLANPQAIEEIRRPIEWHLVLQARLRELGFLPADEHIDGIYGTSVRAAIQAWQNANSRFATGFLSNSDAASLLDSVVRPSSQNVFVPNMLAREQRFPIVHSSDGRYAVQVSGTIVPGDLQHLKNALNTIPIASHPVILLDSPGGAVLEGVDIAVLIHNLGLPTFVTDHCMSICFVMFVASSKLGYEANAQIGVHSAREGASEQETVGSMTSTMIMVRSAQSYRPIPPQILGKLVGTTPDGITILTADDLHQLGAQIYFQTPTTVAVQPVVLPPPTAFGRGTPGQATPQQGISQLDAVRNDPTAKETLVFLVIGGGILLLVYRQKR